MGSCIRLLLLGWACLLTGCSTDSYDYSLGDNYVLYRHGKDAATLCYDGPGHGQFQLLNGAVRRACTSTHYVLVEVDAHRYEEGKRVESFYLVDKQRITEPGYGAFGPYSRSEFRRAIQQANTPDCLLAGP